jgi:hypothetical protein
MAETTTRTQQRSYQATDETARALAELRETFRVPTDSAVVRRALALARVMAQEAGEDHTVTVLRRDGTPMKILLDG